MSQNFRNLGTLNGRKLIARIIIASGIALAVLVSRDRPSGKSKFRWLTWLYRLARHEPLRVIAHLGIFGGAAFLLGPWGESPQRGSRRLVWTHILTGGVLLEMAQMIVRRSSFSVRLIKAVVFDLVTDGVGAVIALTFIDRSR